MYNVMIVEDEILVSIGLKNMIDWAGMNMQVVAEAQNGKTAYEIYKKIKPNLILTDIKMPVMDGLELISKIRANDRKTKIIILTCYQEFDLIHKALKLGVSDYILKLKMSTDEMESVIKKVYDELESEGAFSTAGNLHIETRPESNKFILDYVLSPGHSDVSFESITEGMKLRIKPSRLVLCLMNILNYERIYNEYDAGHEETIRDSILKMIDELLAKYNRGEITHIRNGEFLLVFSFGDVNDADGQRELLLEILDQISEMSITYVNAIVAFGISEFFDGFSSLKDQYLKAVSALKQSYFIGGKFILYGDINNNKNFLASIESFHKFIESVDNLSNDYRKEILAGTDQLKNMFSASKAEVQELFIQWIHWPAFNTSLYRKDNSRLALDYAVQVRGTATINETIEVFEEYIQIIIESQYNIKYISREISEAVNYIKNNYKNEITLQKVSGMVEMSMNYFSYLFKKELQISFVDFINQIRIDKAKELLLTTHLKTYEVSQEVGFTDESYFSRIFKKNTGLRPIDFKKQSFSNGDAI